jgi:hypothetical protein
MSGTHLQTQLTPNQAKATFAQFFDQSIRGHGDSSSGLRQTLGLVDSANQNPHQKLLTSQLATEIRSEAQKLFQPGHNVITATMSDKEVVDKFLGACYRASLEPNRARSLPRTEYPEINNSVEAYNSLSKLAIHVITADCGATLVLGKKNSKDKNDIPYIDALKMGLSFEKTSPSHYTIITPSMNQPLLGNITLSGSFLGEQTLVASGKGTNNPTEANNQNSDTTLAAKKLALPETVKQRVRADLKPQKPSGPTLIIPEDKSLFQSLGLNGAYEKQTTQDPAIQKLWENCDFTLDGSPQESSRKLSELKKWYSNGRSLERALDSLSTTNATNHSFVMDGSHDSIVLNFNSKTKETFFNEVVGLELSKRGISIESPQGSTLSFWKLAQHGCQFSFANNTAYVTYRGLNGSQGGLAIPNGSTVKITPSKFRADVSLVKKES